MSYLFFDRLNLGATLGKIVKMEYEAMTMRQQHYNDVIPVFSTHFSNSLSVGIFWCRLRPVQTAWLAIIKCYTPFGECLMWATSYWIGNKNQRWIDSIAIILDGSVMEKATCSVAIWHTRSVACKTCQARTFVCMK